MRLALIFDKLRDGTTGTYLERACRTLGVACDHWWLRDVERLPGDYDLYVRVDQGDGYDVPMPARLRPAVFYAIDTHLAHSWRKIRRMAPRYDLVFCCHLDGAERLPRAEWLPVACDAALHTHPAGRPLRDVAFVGTDGGVPRKFYLQALRERYPKSLIGNADHTELAAIYGRAKVGFNYSIASDVNMRSFEVLAAGALLVTNPALRDAFGRLGLADRRHLVLYRSPQELFSLIEHFLANREERIRIARAGQTVVLERHTYVHRMRQLLTRAADVLGVTVSLSPQEPLLSCAFS